MVVLPKTTRDIGEHLSQLHAQEKKDSRQIFLKILQNIKFLALQNLPLQGDDDSNSNFIHLIKLRGLDDSRIAQWLQKRSSKYISPDIQNEILEIMSLKILRDLASQIRKATFYRIRGNFCGM